MREWLSQVNLHMQRDKRERDRGREKRTWDLGGDAIGQGCSLDRVSIVSVTAGVTVRVQPVLQVGLLGSLVQNLHVEQMLLKRKRDRKRERERERDRERQRERERERS